MLYLPSKAIFQKKYILYADNYMQAIKKKEQQIPSNIGIKIQHGISMMKSVENVTKESGFFNESYYLSAALEGAAHDIGRFPQYSLIGSLDDSILEEKTGFKDHGDYGRHLLLKENGKLLRYFLEQESPYDYVFTEVIGEHTNIQNPLYREPISHLTHLFQDYSLEEIVNSNNSNIISQLIALKLILLQEMDSLELLQNVMNEAWIPTISCAEQDFTHPDIWDDFTHFRYIDMAKYKKDGRWTCNAGFLLRYGLLTRQMKLVCSLKTFQVEDGFKKVWETTTNYAKKRRETTFDPLLIAGQEYIQMAVKNLIITSPDGILLTEDSKEKAKEKTLREWKQLH